MEDPLWFIAIIPPADIAAEVTAFKEYAAGHFHSRHALRSPSHITLIPPFRFSLKRLRALQQHLRDFAESRLPFELELRDFDCFAPRVIFVKVEAEPELDLLQSDLQKSLQAEVGLRPNDERSFHPHMTVAFKDLDRGTFPVAWAHFQEQRFHRRFPVRALVLLTHQAGGWRVFSELPFEPHKDAVG